MQPSVGAFRIPGVSDAAEGLFDVVTSIFDRVPGSEWIKKAISAGATWLGDWAKTPLGFWTLQVITNNLYGPLARTTFSVPGTVISGAVGPQIATAVFAVPGMVAGESFTEAYVKEMVNRVVALIEYLAQKSAAEAARQATQAGKDAAIAAGKKITDEVVKTFTDEVKRLANDPSLRDVVAKLERDLNAKVGTLSRDAIRRGLDKIGWSPEQIAKKLKVRADSAATALNGIFRKPIYDVGAVPEFNAEDGSPKVLGAPDPLGAPLPNVELARAQKRLNALGLLRLFDYALGVEDRPTTNAIRSFQSTHGLPPTGTADRATNNALQAAIDAKKPIVPFSEVQRLAIQRGIAVGVNGAPPPAAQRNLFGHLLTLSLVTSPLWLALLVLPKWKAARGSRSTRRRS